VQLERIGKEEGGDSCPASVPIGATPQGGKRGDTLGRLVLENGRKEGSREKNMIDRGY